MATPVHTQRARLAAGAVLALLSLALLAGSAHAQVANPSVSLDLPAVPVDLGAGNVTELAAQVRNTGSLQGTVTLAVTAPEGWTVVVEPASAFTLAANAQAPVTLTLTAPAAGAGAQKGAVELRATIQDAAGRTGSDAASVGVSRVDPAPVPPPPPPDPFLMLLLGLAVAAVPTSGAAFYWRRKQLQREAAEAAEAARVAEERRVAEEQARLAAERAEAERRRLELEAAAAAAAKAAHEAWLARETGITLHLVDGPIRFGTRRELTYRVRVENVSERPRIAILGVAETPEGWTAAFSVPRLPLSAGEAAVVTVYVNAADAVPEGTQGNVVLTARPEEAQELDERLTLTPVAPAVRIPLEEAFTSVVVARAPIVPRPVLRK